MNIDVSSVYLFRLVPNKSDSVLKVYNQGMQLKEKSLPHRIKGDKAPTDFTGQIADVESI